MTLPKEYKKTVATEKGRDFNKILQVQSENLVLPGAGEILVKNKFAGVNASDLNMMAGAYFADIEPPFDLGFEFAGEVAAIGDGVDNLKVGDKIIGIKAGGGYREFVTMNSVEAIPVPVLDPGMMSLITVGLAASIGLEKVGEMRSSDTVLITAAAGGVGNIAVQLAKNIGCHVVATCGSEDKVQMLKDLGCDRVINYNAEDLHKVLQKEYPNGIDLVFENVGGKMYDASLKNLAKLGRLVVCGFVSEYQLDTPEVISSPRVYHDLLWKSASVRAFLFSDFPELIPVHLQKLMEMTASGKLNIIVDTKEFIGTEGVKEALNYMYDGKNQGKVIVKF